MNKSHNKSKMDTLLDEVKKFIQERRKLQNNNYINITSELLQKNIEEKKKKLQKSAKKLEDCKVSEELNNKLENKIKKLEGKFNKLYAEDFEDEKKKVVTSQQQNIIDQRKMMLKYKKYSDFYCKHNTVFYSE